MTKQLLYLTVISAFIYFGQGMMNFALNKFAVQSESLFYNGFFWTADKAVDGNTNGINPEIFRTCSATEVKVSWEQPYWEVDIGFQIIVKTITVYGRTDGKDQLSDFTLYLGNNSRPRTYNQQSPRSSAQNNTYVFEFNNIVARVISLIRIGNILTVCEVTVEGECLGGVLSGFCDKTCGQCFHGQSCDETGMCPHGCDPGWKGPICDKACDNYYYGNCGTTCGHCRKSTPCNKVNGSCTLGLCSEGWMTEKCDTECDLTHYGENCAHECGHCLNGTCDRASGNCLMPVACQSGWKGSRCDMACDNYYYGNCTTKCGHCKNSLVCNKVNGFCPWGHCSEGWMGEKCDAACDDGYYGNCTTKCGHCRNSTICNKVNGSCPSGQCSEGWMGEKCDTECDWTHHGENCAHQCGHCLNETCDRVSGNCLANAGCQSGWKGSRCDIACDDDYYGNCTTKCGHCRNSTICNKVNGSCTSGQCSEGWMGEKCDTVCDNDYYGNCTTKCGHCRNSTACNKVNGSCPSGQCSEGWIGEKCDTECDSKHYGENCAHQCGHCLNGTCDRVSGNCLLAASCLSGWQGSRCDTGSENFQETGVDVGLVGGSVSAAIAIVAGIVSIVVIVVVKRRRKTPLSKIPNAKDLSKIKDDVVVYENTSFVNINDGMVTVTEARNGAKANTQTIIAKQGKMLVKLNKEDTETYYNIGRALPQETIPLSRLWDYVQEKFLDDKFFSEEFEKLPSGPQLPMTVALRSENRNKNRYKQLYPYDVNRVLLNPLSNDDSDYINASFIDGYSGPKMYIAPQGTTKDNINDFWRMLWQYDVGKIVMLTGLMEGGRHKCELYWPVEEGQTSTFGSVAVRLLDTDLFADYDIRTIEMSVGNQSKHLTQFHYTAWPDKGVPKTASSIVNFWNGVNKVTTNAPIVVHCSAGIGRTGTYISLDYLANQAKADGHVNVSACVSNLRCQRVDLVQTKEQYIFLHEALVEALMLSGTATFSDNFPKVYSEILEVDRESGKIKLQLEYERLQNEVVSHETVYATIKMEDNEGEEENLKQDEFSAARKPENRAKNRHDTILPADRHRVLLSTLVSGRNDYINAVIVPSHRQKVGFILTQMPLTDTVIDFWRMVNDFEIRTIIMFNSESSKTHDIGIYWPTDGEGEMRYGPFSVRLTKQEKHKHYIARTISFSVIGDEATRDIKQFQFKKWSETADVPENTESFLQLLDAADKWQKEKEQKPVVVHCINGAQRSGLYCVIYTVIDRLMVERDVAIVQTIKRMRAIRQQTIPNYEQFRFCHECILQYMKTLETYSNF